MVCCCDFSGKVPAVGCVDDVLDGLFNFQGSSIIKGSIHHSPFEAVFESRHFDADIWYILFIGVAKNQFGFAVLPAPVYIAHTFCTIECFCKLCVIKIKIFRTRFYQTG